MFQMPAMKIISKEPHVILAVLAPAPKSPQVTTGHHKCQGCPRHSRMSCSKASWNMAVSCCLSQVHCARLSWFCKDLCTSVLRLYKPFEPKEQHNAPSCVWDQWICGSEWDQLPRSLRTSFTLCYNGCFMLAQSQQSSSVQFITKFLRIHMVGDDQNLLVLESEILTHGPWPMSSARSP